MTHDEKKKLTKIVEKAQGEISFILTKLSADIESASFKSVEFEKKIDDKVSPPF